MILVYRLLHFIGLFMVLLAVGGQLLNTMNGGEKRHPSKKFLGMQSGIGLVLLLVGGFGLLARMKLGFDGWVLAKIAIWFYLGFAGFIVAKAPKQAKSIWFATVAAVALAAIMAIYKPF